MKTSGDYVMDYAQPLITLQRFTKEYELAMLKGNKKAAMEIALSMAELSVLLHDLTL